MYAYKQIHSHKMDIRSTVSISKEEKSYTYNCFYDCPGRSHYKDTSYVLNITKIIT